MIAWFVERRFAVLLFVTIVCCAAYSTPVRATATAADSATLARICRYLEEGTPNQAAAAERQLQSEIGSDQTELLRTFLSEQSYPVAGRLLRARLSELLTDRIRGVEERIEFFDEARRLSRQHAAELAEFDRSPPTAAKEPTTPEDPKPADAPDDSDDDARPGPDGDNSGDTDEAEDDPGVAKKTPAEQRQDLEERLQQQRRARDDARRGIRESHEFLLRQGLALAPVLFHRRSSGGVPSDQIRRFHEQLEAHLIAEAQRIYPQPPQSADLANLDTRSLVPLLEELVTTESKTGWAGFRNALADRAIELLGSYHPADLEEGRHIFLELGEWGTSRLDRWVASSDARVPTSLRRLYGEWNRLAVPPELVERTGLPLGSYRSADLPRRLQLIYRLEWVGQDLAIPVFHQLLRLEPNLSLRVEVAAALARLDDPRGAAFLRQLGLQNALVLEGVSRQVLLIEAIHRRETGDLDGAIQDLLTLSRRFPNDARVHYELGYASLLARRFDLSIKHFLRSIEIESRDHLAHYNLACAYALAGQPEPALEELYRAIETGFKDGAHMAQDPDLESLRQLPRFQELLDDLSDPNR